MRLLVAVVQLVHLTSRRCLFVKQELQLPHKYIQEIVYKQPFPTVGG